MKSSKSHIKADLFSPAEQEELDAFVRRVRQARLRRNLTQQDVAERAHLSRSAVIALEQGNARASLGSVLRILGALGFTSRLSESIAVDIDGELMERDLGRQRAGRRHVMADF